MTPDELVEYAAAYFAHWQRYLRTRASRAERLALMYDPDAFDPTELDDLLKGGAEEAERAWPIILALIAHAPNEEALSYIAAGPLENLVQHHAAQFADRLIGEAQLDARFLFTLGGVWGWEKVPELHGRLVEIIKQGRGPGQPPRVRRRNSSARGGRKRRAT
jgi:hypothetical protein